MKKAILLAGMLTLFTSLPASAQIIFEPMIVTQAPPQVLFVPPAYYVIEPARYPVHYDHHRPYNWRYWQEHREHEGHERHEEHRERDGYDHR